MPSIREDCSAVRLSSFWNCASRHHGKPNDCPRTGAATARSSRATRSGPRVVSLMRKPHKKLLLKRIRRAAQLYLSGDKFLRKVGPEWERRRRGQRDHTEKRSNGELAGRPF